MHDDAKRDRTHLHLGLEDVDWLRARAPSWPIRTALTADVRRRDRRRDRRRSFARGHRVRENATAAVREGRATAAAAIATKPPARLGRAAAVRRQAVRFGSYEYIKSFMQDEKGKLNRTKTLLCGLGAGVSEVGSGRVARERAR